MQPPTTSTSPSMKSALLLSYVLLFIILGMLLPLASPLTTLTLPRSKQTFAFRQGQALIYRKALGPKVDASQPLKTGDICIVRTPNQSNGYDKIGIGVYNAGDTMYAVRILAHHSEPIYSKVTSLSDPGDDEVVGAIFTSALSRCVATRRTINLPSPGTDSFRLVNGEGDGLSGLCVDLYSDDLAVCMSSAAYVQIYRRTIASAVKDVLGTDNVVWKTTKSRLKQDGYDGEDDSDDDQGPSGPMIIQENNVKYSIQPVGSQKTGFYTDQRSNRQLISQVSAGKRVLDLCCYVGSFSLNAAVNGRAEQCVGVDSSRDAIEAARHNAELNGVSGKCEFVVSGIEDYMKQAIEDGEQFDVVILDPPKLAPTMKGLDRASRKYLALNRDALKLVSNSGGLLMTCTCSSAMSTKDGGQFFLNTVKRAALSAGRHVTLHSRTHAAACHTTSPLEGSSNYLTAALMSVAPSE